MNYRQVQIVSVYQQAKTIHKLLLVLADDLGDLSLGRETGEVFGALSDIASGEIEPAMQRLRDKLSAVVG